MKEIDNIIGRAIINGKPIQMGYYYGRLVELSQQITFTNDIKDELTFYKLWNKFRVEVTEEFDN